METLKPLLETAYRDFHSLHHRERDPVSLVHPYADPRDQELAGLITALLSYGNVATILGSVRRALTPLGARPSEALRLPPNTPLWEGFRHRFTTGEDLWVLSWWLHRALEQSGSLEAFFLQSQGNPRPPMKVLLSSFVQRLKALPLPAPVAAVAKRRHRQLKYLLSDPVQGSACKRLNMYLRWMVRPMDGVDLGVWTRLEPGELILPVDTHLLKTLRQLRWTRSRQANWKVAEKATDRLRRYCPEDPVRYDFSLCHLSMEGFRLKGARR